MAAAKNRARMEVMHYILSFCVSHRYGGRLAPGIEGFVGGYSSEDSAVPGDLVLLKSAPPSKWIVGWLVESEQRGDWTHYLIESLEDGALAWWHNVGLAYFPRDKLNPTWRWTDRQWAFNDRWFRVCYKEKSAYIAVPVTPEFDNDFSVTLSLRTRFGLDDIQPRRSFTDWRKVTKAMMATAFDEMVEEREHTKAARGDSKLVSAVPDL